MKDEINLKEIGIIGTSAFFTANCFRKIEPRLRGSLMMAGGLLTVLSNTEANTNLIIGSGLFIAGTADILYSFIGGEIVENLCEKSVWCKPESSDEPYELKPGNNIGIFQKVDGIATNYKPGHVFKIPNGCRVVIKENGEVVLASKMSMLINELLEPEEQANWKSLVWIENGRQNWKKLYLKSLTY